MTRSAEPGRGRWIVFEIDHHMTCNCLQIRVTRLGWHTTECGRHTTLASAVSTMLSVTLNADIWLDD